MDHTKKMSMLIPRARNKRLSESPIITFGLAESHLLKEQDPNLHYEKDGIETVFAKPATPP